jgi:hypothetical protein
MNDNPTVIMEGVLREHEAPEDKRVSLDYKNNFIKFFLTIKGFTLSLHSSYNSFPHYEKRKLFVHARLQSLSILGIIFNSSSNAYIHSCFSQVNSNAIQNHLNDLLYDRLIEELVDVFNAKKFGFSFPEIKR